MKTYVVVQTNRESHVLSRRVFRNEHESGGVGFVAAKVRHFVSKKEASACASDCSLRAPRAYQDLAKSTTRTTLHLEGLVELRLSDEAHFDELFTEANLRHVNLRIIRQRLRVGRVTRRLETHVAASVLWIDGGRHPTRTYVGVLYAVTIVTVSFS